jgi:hypothetical protein
VDRPLVDRLSCQGHSPGSHVGSGEALKAYKRETPLKMTSCGAPEDYRVYRPHVYAQ